MAISNEIESKGYNIQYKSIFSFNDYVSMDVLAYLDHTEKNSDIFLENRDIYNLEANYHHKLGLHYVSAGGFYRRVSDDNQQRIFGIGGFSLHPLSKNDELVSLFIQDKWQASDNLNFLGGIRYEHNDYTGWEYNPTLRGNYTFLVWR